MDKANTLGKYTLFSEYCLVSDVGDSPGRFFAASELKAMLAYVLLTYDIMVPHGKRPQDWEIGIRTLPNMNANVMFRLRSKGSKSTDS